MRNCKRHNPIRRKSTRGVTLIEVMMSTMVVSIGILGLVALIPLGTHLTERGTRADRIASVGERAFHEAMARGAFSPGNWVIPTGELTSSNAQYWLTDPIRLPIRQPYLIDPMFFGNNGYDTTRSYFPYPTSLYGGATNDRQTTGKPMQMWRVGLRRSGGVAPLSSGQSKLAFQSDDDLAFERPSDGELPSFQRFYTRTTATSSIKRQSLGEYSWMIMMTPEPFDLSRVSSTAPSGDSVQPPITYANITTSDLQSAVAIAATDEYTASIIIMKNRVIPGLVTTPGATPSLTDLDDEIETVGERVLQVDATSFLPTGGYSTGEITLQQMGGTREDAEKRVLKLNNGDWICLVGRLPETTTAPKQNYPRGDVYQWYRVVMVDDVVDSNGSSSASVLPFSRRVTISGPDWTSGLTPTHAILVDGVVGVYTKRVRLESRSPWSP